MNNGCVTEINRVEVIDKHIIEIYDEFYCK